MNRYTIRRVGIFSLSKAGCLLGALVSLIPSLFCSIGGLILSRGLYRWLGGLRNAELDLGFPVTADLVSMFRLEALLQRFQTVARLSPLLVLVLAILLSLVGGFIIALIFALAGWGYNVIARLAGGLVVELKEAGPADRQMA